MRIALENFGAARNRAPTVLATNENMNKAAGNLGGHFPQIRFVATASRGFDFEVLAVIVVILLQGFDKKIVQGKPDGTAPVGVAAKNTAGGFSWLVVDAVDVVIHLDLVRVIEVIAGERTDAIRRQELRFVQHAAEHALKLFAIGERKQSANTACGALRHFNVFRHVRVIVNKPLHAALESGQAVDNFRLESLHSKKWNQADHGANLQEVIFAARQMKNVVVETVFVVPE